MSEKEKKKEAPLAISRRKLMGEAPVVVNELLDNCLYSGFFGTLDSARLKQVIDALMGIVTNSNHEYLIIDLSNVEIIDSTIANQLIKMTKTLRLVGLEVIYCGIRPLVAQSMVSAGIIIDSELFIAKNLKIALREVLRQKGLEIVKIDR